MIDIHRRRLAVPPRDRRGPLITVVVVATVLGVTHVLAWRATEVSPAALVDGWQGMARFLGEALPPDLAWDRVVMPGIEACLTTLAIGLLGTTLSIPPALVLA
ncbi:MAG: phosphonate ABC transporter, permease protein PhnE, partial [Actinomycetota bacterium]|nr:phosphonate ABC transporter, permease protein PhnE [Actinomycetota bacterium]